MPSPFLGMDPYLEAPSVWRNVHNSFIAYLTEKLNTVLPPDYVAQTDARVYVLRLEMVEPFVKIWRYQEGEEHTVVTIIEVLSPSNK